MPQTPHVETHVKGSETVRDMVIGGLAGTAAFAIAKVIS